MGSARHAEAGGSARLESTALGHEEAPGLGLLAEVHRLQLLLQLAHLLRLGLRRAAQPLELAHHRRVQQQLPRLPQAVYLTLAPSVESRAAIYWLDCIILPAATLPQKLTYAMVQGGCHACCMHGSMLISEGAPVCDMHR